MENLSGLSNNELYLDSLVDEIKEKTSLEGVGILAKFAKQQSVDFGRWLLANAEVKLDENDAWTWNYEDKNMSTSQMFEIYFEENDTNY